MPNASQNNCSCGSFPWGNHPARLYPIYPCRYLKSSLHFTFSVRGFTRIQGFSTSTLVTFWTGYFSFVGAALYMGGCLASSTFSSPPPTKCQKHITLCLTPGCDNQKCLQMLHKAPWGGKWSLTENPWSLRVEKSGIHKWKQFHMDSPIGTLTVYIKYVVEKDRIWQSQRWEIRQVPFCTECTVSCPILRKKRKKKRTFIFATFSPIDVKIPGRWWLPTVW